MDISGDQAASKAHEPRATYYLADFAAVALLLSWDAEITLQPLVAQVEMSSVPPHLLQAWAAQVAPLAPDGWALRRHLSSYAGPPPTAAGHSRPPCSKSSSQGSSSGGTPGA